MKKLIIAIIAIIFTTNAFSQNYFSEILTMDEFGVSKSEKINGRININDSTIVIKTANGKIETLNILLPYEYGTKNEPSEKNGMFYYDKGYSCYIDDTIVIFVKRTIVTQYAHNYENHFWVIWYTDKNGEVIKTKRFDI